MKRKPKRHDHLKRLYREELTNRDTASQPVTADGSAPMNTASAASVMTAAEQRWLRRDLLRSVVVVLLLLTVIALLAVYQNNNSIVGFTAKVAHWGGF